MNKKQIIATTALVAVLGVAGVYGVTAANAATETSGFSPVVQRLVERFSLNRDEVSKVVEEDRTERQAERKASFEAKLTEAVTAGTITESQKAAVIAKHDELQATRESLRDQNRENRGSMRTQMQATRTEMQEFLKDQGIDESLLPQPQGPQGGMGIGGGMHRRQNS